MIGTFLEESSAVPSRCLLPLDQGFGDQNLSYWYYDNNSNQCMSFIYKGNGGNANQYHEKQQCQNICR